MYNIAIYLYLTGVAISSLFDKKVKKMWQGERQTVDTLRREVDPTAKYRIATLDYLAQGNDKLVAFKAKTDVVSPQDEHNNVRYIIMDYFREHQNVGAAKEGRIIVNP